MTSIYWVEVVASFLEVYNNVFSVLLRVVKSMIFFTELQSNREKNSLNFGCFIHLANGSLRVL